MSRIQNSTNTFFIDNYITRKIGISKPEGGLSKAKTVIISAIAWSALAVIGYLVVVVSIAYATGSAVSLAFSTGNIVGASIAFIGSLFLFANAEIKRTPVCSYEIAMKDATYANSEQGNVDFSHANKKLGFGYVVDGSGHNNPQMKIVLEDILDKFNRNYEQEIAKQKFNTIEEAQDFLIRTFYALGQTLVDDPRPVKNDQTFDNNSFQPAISFVQIITINKRRYLLSFELADATLVIKRSDGTFDTSLATPKDNNGLGAVNVKAAREDSLKVRVTPIRSGDTIFGFTDGIGEFLTMTECLEIINSTPQYSNLMQNFKEKIVEKGEGFIQKGEHRDIKETSANSSRFIKFHSPDPDSSRYHDDISLFVLALP